MGSVPFTIFKKRKGEDGIKSVYDAERLQQSWVYF